MPMTEEIQSDYDSPWQLVLDTYFEEFVAFFFPHAQIDWTKQHESLDKELQQVVRDAALGKRLVDKLIKVWLKSGDEAWVLVHIEVQSQEESGFSERMFVYNYRIYDRYRRRVASLAVLGDERLAWRPSQFGYELFDCRMQFQFPIVKLADYGAQWQALEASRNPFATVVMAHLKTQETRDNGEERKSWKLSLVKRLYDQGLQRQDILDLFQFIDWILALPQDLEDEFLLELAQYEGERRMQYITSMERKGLKQGLLSGIALGLELKFGSEGLDCLPEISQIQDVKVLETVLERLKTSSSLDEFRRVYQDSLPA